MCPTYVCSTLLVFILYIYERFLLGLIYIDICISCILVVNMNLVSFIVKSFLYYYDTHL